MSKQQTLKYLNRNIKDGLLILKGMKHNFNNTENYCLDLDREDVYNGVFDKPKENTMVVYLDKPLLIQTLQKQVESDINKRDQLYKELVEEETKEFEKLV